MPRADITVRPDDLLQCRKAAGLTQDRLAETLGLHHTFVSHLESGRRGASLGTIIRIAKALNVTVDQIANIDPELAEAVA